MPYGGAQAKGKDKQPKYSKVEPRPLHSSRKSGTPIAGNRMISAPFAYQPVNISPVSQYVPPPSVRPPIVYGSDMMISETASMPSTKKGNSGIFMKHGSGLIRKQEMSPRASPAEHLTGSAQVNTEKQKKSPRSDILMQ